MTIDPEKLRSAMRAWTAGVTIVTASFEGIQHGMTVNSFTSVSLDPAWITISLQQSSRTRDLIHRSEAFGITILTQDQQELADRFAGRIPDMEDASRDWKQSLTRPGRL
jgi:flavin reductase (DIM6/NTAB) family NADH-FMN oxidoreductase RutF